jgi:hypothetical protein
MSSGLSTVAIDASTPRRRPFKGGLQLRHLVLAEHRRRRGVVHGGDALGGRHALRQRAGMVSGWPGSIGATGAIQPRVAAS